MNSKEIWGCANHRRTVLKHFFLYVMREFTPERPYTSITVSILHNHFNLTIILLIQMKFPCLVSAGKIY